MSVHAPKEPETCRNCGGLVAPQSVQCRRCGRYKDAGPVENTLLHDLGPQSTAPIAATMLLSVIIVLWDMVILLVTRGDALPAASGFTLIQFCALDGPRVVFARWCRTATGR